MLITKINFLLRNFAARAREARFYAPKIPQQILDLTYKIILIRTVSMSWLRKSTFYCEISLRARVKRAFTRQKFLNKFWISPTKLYSFEASRRADYENQLFIAKLRCARAWSAFLRAKNSSTNFGFNLQNYTHSKRLDVLITKINFLLQNFSSRARKALFHARSVFNKFRIYLTILYSFEASRWADYENQLHIAKFCFARA